MDEIVKKNYFWQSIRFKLVLNFVLCLLFSLGISAFFFIDELVKQDIVKLFIFISSITVVVYILIVILIVHLLTQPIAQLKKQAVQIYNGDYAKKVIAKGELNQFGEIFNELAARMTKTQRIVEFERNRLHSVLKHITDGVIATDRMRC